MKIGPSFLKIGQAVLYPLAELEAWDRAQIPTPVYIAVGSSLSANAHAASALRPENSTIRLK